MEDAPLYTKFKADEEQKSDRYRVTGRGSWGDAELWDPITLLNELNIDQNGSGDSNQLLKRENCHHFGGLKHWYKRKVVRKFEAPLRKILSPSSPCNENASLIFSSLSRKPVLTSSPVALKALVILHRLLLHQGSRDCLSCSYSKAGFLREIGNSWASRTQDPLHKLIPAYSSLLNLKLTFHHRFPFFENNYSLELSSLDHPGDSESSTYQAINELQKLQEGTFHAGDAGLMLLEEKNVTNRLKELDELRGNGAMDSVQLIVGALISLLKEADLIYDITSFLLSSVEFSAEQSPVFNKFEEHHKLLKLLYERAQTEPGVVLLALLPSLPEHPSVEKKINKDEPPRVNISGGVGAAAAAAVQRFKEGQRRAATAADTLFNRKLEAPQFNFLEAKRPQKPQHSRMWCSFDDAAFFHQDFSASPSASFQVQPCPVFYSPKRGGGAVFQSPLHDSNVSPLLGGAAATLGINFSSVIVNVPEDSVIVADRVAQQHEHLQQQLEHMQLQIQQQQQQLQELQKEREDRIPKQNEIPSSWQIGGSASAWEDFSMNEERKQEESTSPDWTISFSELELGQKIGQGAFGDVLRGSWQGTEVAVKRLQNVSSSNFSQTLADFEREVEVVMKLRHPNIVLCMGACTRPPETCIVMEYAANGSLYNVLHNPNVAIDMLTVVRWATEAARGMNYLHTRTPVILHRDLKSANLLVDEDWHIKVSDFGLAMTKQKSHAHSQVGTWGWMAPEVLELSPYNEKADVYSFGVVLWELITREEPFKGFHPMQIMRAVDRGERLQIPESSPCAYRELIENCWQRSPENRPNFEQILGRLKYCLNV